MQHEDLAGGHGVYRSIYLCWVEEVLKGGSAIQCESWRLRCGWGQGDNRVEIFARADKYSSG